MRKRSSRFLGLVLAAGTALALVSCGSAPDGGAVVLQAGDAAPAAVLGADASEQSLSASRAFFAASPVVVLTTPDQVEDGIEVASKRGVPVLVPGPDRDELIEELTRLGTTHVLALHGSEEGETTIGPATVVTAAGDLPKVAKAEAAKSTVILAKDADALDPFSAAAAEITGATLVEVPTGDPRTDPDVIEELADLDPQRVVAIGDTFGSAEAAAGLVSSAATGTQVPGGGQLVLPGKRYIAMYGHPGTPALGVLGEQGLDAAVTRSRKLAAEYEDLSEDPVIPLFEIITTVATAGAGADGDYSNEVPADFYEPWVERAQEEDIYVLLDIQPGTDHMLDQVQQYESLLKYPNVGVALDPEWKLKPGQRHMRQIGQVDAAEINEVTEYLAQLTRDNQLPQKMVVLHQFQNRMITNRDKVDTSHPELALVIHADGHGTHAQKLDTWNALRRNASPDFSWAWKNFYDEDSPMMTPAQTMRISPQPVLVSYQ